ncbi:hypothetical protein FKM82_002923 [Ascaphus truei]
MHTQQELLTNVFIVLNTEWSLLNMSEWLGVFDILIADFIVALNETHISQLPLNISCGNYQAIIKKLSDVYSKLNDMEAKSVYSYGKSYLTQQHKSTGSACTSNTSGSKEWITKYFGAFVTSTTFSELQQLYPNLDVAVLPDVLTPSDMAVLLTKQDILTNTSLLTAILSHIEPENVTEYVSAITTAAAQANLSDSQLTTLKETLLDVVLTKLSSDFYLYGTEDWKTLLQKDLALLLPNFNQTLLQLLPTNITCSSYQEIVKGFSITYESLSTQTKDDVYIGYIKKYMSQQSSPSGLACDTANFTTWVEVNIGKFIQQSTAEDLAQFNKNVSKVENIATLTPTQLAEFTIAAELLHNSTLAGIILNRIKQLNTSTEVNDYLLKILYSLCRGSVSSCAVPDVLSVTTKRLILTGVVEFLHRNWIVQNTPQWLEVFSTLVKTFLPEITGSDIAQLPAHMPCDTAKGIATVMNNAYAQLIPDLQSAVYKYLLSYHKDSKLACDTTGNLPGFIRDYFLSFSAMLSAGDLLSLIPAEQLSQKINTLQPKELVDRLLPSGHDVNSTVWAITLSSYTNITNLGLAMDILHEKMVNMSLEVRASVFNAVWPSFLGSLGSLDASNTDIWLNQRLRDYLPLITKAQLNVTEIINANCFFYKNLVKTLTIHYGNYTTSNQQDIYSVFKTYLLNSSSKPRCYISSDSGANSWISSFLGDYLTFCSAADLKSFSDNENLLQSFSVDPVNLDLVKRLNLSEDLKMYYAELIAAKDSSIALDSIPANILCYAIDKLNVGNTNENQALQTLEILKQCGNTSTVTLGNEVLTSLLSSVSSITPDTLLTLGPLAVGIPSSILLGKINGSTVQKSLPSLSQYPNWSVTQASAILTKLTQTDFKINSSNLISLGTLVIGIPAHEMDTLTKTEVLTLAANQNFTSSMERAPSALKQRFVQKIIESSSGNIFLSVPDNLASEIPTSKLVTSITNISEINPKKWTSEQAQVFFQTVVKITPDYSVLSANVLQGFSCGAAKILTASQFVNLVKSMNGKAVKLEDSQLSCMAKRLRKGGAPADVENYPSDVLLYIGSSSYTSTSACKQYFSRVGQANIALLPQGSSQRASLLSSAKTCLNIMKTITKENLQVLGALSCDLTGQEITDSDPYILTVLQSCSSFTDQQKEAIETQLTSKYGSANTWTASTLNEIGSLAGSLRSGVLQQIPQALKIRFFPGFLSKLKTQHKTSISFIMTQLKITMRTNRAPTCTALTTDIVAKERDLVAVRYTSSELEACLPNDVLRDNLEILGGLEFSDDQLQVLKTKLDVIYPSGVPEEYLPHLGNLARMYSTDEIAKWTITKVDTLAALLEGTSWQSLDTKVNALVTRYLQASGARLDGTALTILSSYICSLSENQIQSINIEDISASSKFLDTSTCSQNKKDLIFDKMKAAYQPVASSGNAYFQLLKSVIGGTKAEDLIQFAAGSPEMDITAFAGLNPDEVKKLAAQNIKDLLGDNLSDLSTISNSAVVKAWVSVNTQSHVNSLGLNILAGVKEPPPNGFIVIPPVTASSGTASHLNTQHVLSVLLACTLVSLRHAITPFL